MISINEEHSKKALVPIKFTNEGIVICFDNEHLLKELFPIEVTEEGIVICVNDEHPEKAENSIEVLTDSVPYPELLSSDMPEYDFTYKVVNKG